MSQPINTEKLKRILLVRTDRMGDVVLTTPVFSAIKKKYSFAYLAVLVSKENVDLVRGNPYLDEVIAYDKFGSEKSWWGAYTFIRRLELKRFDAAILFHPRARMYWTTFLARIPIRIGYRAKNFKLLTHILPYNKPEGTRHEAEYNFDLLKMIGVEPPTQLEFYVPLCEGYQKLIDEHLKSLGRYVVFNPSASTPSKIWSAEYFAQVASNLSKKYNVIPVIIGGKEDAPYRDAMKKHMNGIAIDFTGKLGIGALAWLLKKALLFISNDTGPVHVAASLGT
ncbi:MAG: glycosyltransferase family 9 protein, partial [Candidatus Omnitrophica bacterium]|nr:glycosyltransferase family 9 protein [Candidatus Omnitrophota bacterium]